VSSFTGLFVGFSVGQRALGSLSQLNLLDCLILKKVLGLFETSAAIYQSIKRNALAETDLQSIAVTISIWQFFTAKYKNKQFRKTFSVTV
jgi:hypothetical protein